MSDERPVKLQIFKVQNSKGKIQGNFKLQAPHPG
jgi:hypothetical protein